MNEYSRGDFGTQEHLTNVQLLAYRKIYFLFIRMVVFIKIMFSIPPYDSDFYDDYRNGG